MDPYIVSNEKFPLLSLVVLGPNTRCTLLFQGRGAEMLIAVPLGAFVDTRDRGPRMSTKLFPLGFSRFMRGILYFNIISIEIGVPWCTRRHVTLHSSSTHRPPVCAAISHFLMPSTLYHEIFSSCWLWGPFTEKLPAISTIVSTQQTFRGKTAAKQKTHQSTKGFERTAQLQTIADAFHQDSI